MSSEGQNRPLERDVQLRIGTDIGHANTEEIFVRGENVVDSLMGHVSYTEMLLFTITGKRPSAATTRVVDTVLVSLVDHGMQPTALAARLTYYVAPESIQGALAAGILGAGSVLLGSMEQCARLLHESSLKVAAGSDPVSAIDGELNALLQSGARIPGVGHALHKNGDPRAIRLLSVATEEDFAKDEVALLNIMIERAAEITGKILPLNATGASAALLLAAGIPWELQRGIAIVSRLAGLLAHIAEEHSYPITPAVRSALREASWQGEH